ncbi:MOSC domain-containing protein, partial [Deinococcus sp.]|uniref:MOSC domain-containing protein n=1 Tax=Deinococcus sp. TaxID=47478 RepID=UPI0025BC2EC7
MQLIAVCTGQARLFANKTGQTGIDKRAVPGQVKIGPLGLEGDQVMDRKHHGGPDQAVYIYTRPDYAYWEGQLGRPLRNGEFGENLVFSGLESAAVGIGQRIQVGPVVLEATMSRIPCGTFSQHMNDPHFARKFRDARRPGIYARVIEPGEVQAGDEVRLLGELPAGTPTILDT